MPLFIAAMMANGLTVLGVVLLGWTLFHTRRAANAALEANKGFAEATHRQLRAYVHVGRAQTENVVGRENVVGIKVEIKNFGSTPADELTVVYGASISGSIQCMLREGSEKLGPFVLGPQQERSFTFNFEDSYVKAELSALQAGTKKVRVFGFITYRDYTRRLRRTVFCLRVPYRGEAFGGALSVDAKHNRAN